MGTMMALTMDRQLQSINVIVNWIGAQSMDDHRDRISEHGLEVGEYDGEPDVDWNAELSSLNLQFSPKLRSEEWRKKIRDVAQCFPGGAGSFVRRWHCSL